MHDVRYSLNEQVATIRIDDGKRNALSPDLLRAIYSALDQAEADKASVILTGRESVFSAGFDLKVMKQGGANALRMLRLGYALTARVMRYPYPVVVACNGHYANWVCARMQQASGESAKRSSGEYAGDFRSTSSRLP